MPPPSPPLNPSISDSATAGYTAGYGNFQYDPLLSDGDDIVSITAAFDMAGHAPTTATKLLRGTVMHYVGTGNTPKCWLPAAPADCNAILAADIDLTAVPLPPALIYLSGKVKADALIYPNALAGSELAANDILRDNTILVESVMWHDGKVYRYTDATPGPKLAEDEDAAKKPGEAGGAHKGDTHTHGSAPGAGHPEHGKAEHGKPGEHKSK